MRIYSVDVDGVLFENMWPDLGEPNYDLIDWIVEQQMRGDKFILWTCREGKALERAVTSLKRLGFEPDAVNDNLPFIIEKFGRNSRKVYCHASIDDTNLSCADFNLPYKPSGEKRPLPQTHRKKPTEPVKPQTMKIV